MQTGQEAVLEVLLHRRNAEGACRARPGSDAYEMRQCVDTAIIKLYVDLGNGTGLKEFLSSEIPVLADEEEVVSYLKYSKKQHALAIFYKAKGNDVKVDFFPLSQTRFHSHALLQSLEILKELGQQRQARPVAPQVPDKAASKGGVSGPTGFRKVGGASAPAAEDGVTSLAAESSIADTVAVLEQSSDAKTVFNYSKWVLEQDLHAGIQIFTSTKRREPLPVEEVLGFLFALKNNGALVAEKYLEYVVFEQRSAEEKYVPPPPFCLVRRLTASSQVPHEAGAHVY